ncbi:hypothetical protein QOT17_015092 [Balamuthia mandrillaris]
MTPSASPQRQKQHAAETLPSEEAGSTTTPSPRRKLLSLRRPPLPRRLLLPSPPRWRSRVAPSPSPTGRRGRMGRTASSSPLRRTLPFSPATPSTTIEDLPDELLLYVLRFIEEDVETLCACCHLSQRWYRIANDPLLWRNLFQTHWPNSCLLFQLTDDYEDAVSPPLSPRQRKEEAQAEGGGEERSSTNMTVRGVSRWKRAYLQRWALLRSSPAPNRQRHHTAVSISSSFSTCSAPSSPLSSPSPLDRLLLPLLGDDNAGSPSSLLPSPILNPSSSASSIHYQYHKEQPSRKRRRGRNERPPPSISISPSPSIAVERNDNEEREEEAEEECPFPTFSSSPAIITATVTIEPPPPPISSSSSTSSSSPSSSTIITYSTKAKRRRGTSPSTSASSLQQPTTRVMVSSPSKAIFMGTGSTGGRGCSPTNHQHKQRFNAMKKAILADLTRACKLRREEEERLDYERRQNEYFAQVDKEQLIIAEF